ncbi:hypothetical protein [Shouchella tritolerans]|uniref:hypothetical protein n=1 Tax=Shouchella tritolerans TaxID=2979466 RepID=UPI0021E8337D|nr:hypothetical protein [Shouchella tritolerans]
MENNKKTMSFRFDHNEPLPPKKTPAKTSEQEENPPLEVLTWDGTPFQKPEEEAIKESSGEDEFLPKPDKVIDLNRKREERGQEERFWDDGNRSKSPKLPPKKRKRPINWTAKAFPWNIVAAVVSAIVVGVGLGAVLYQFVIASPAQDQTPQAVSVTASGQVAFPTMQVDVVQGAAFDEPGQEEQVIQSTKAKGLPATLIGQEEPYFMFVGVAGDRSRAEELGALVSKAGQDVYVKTYTVEGGVPEAGGEAAAAWFTDAYSLYSALADLSSSQLLAADDSPLNQGQLQQLNTAVAELRSNRDGAFDELGEEAKPFALAMSDALSEATVNLESYQEKAEEPLLWATQQALLQALSDYENAIAAIKQ